MQETSVRRTYCPETRPERNSALKGLCARFIFNIPTRRRLRLENPNFEFCNRTRNAKMDFTSEKDVRTLNKDST